MSCADIPRGPNSLQKKKVKICDSSSSEYLGLAWASVTPDQPGQRELVGSGSDIRKRIALRREEVAYCPKPAKLNILLYNYSSILITITHIY